MTPHDWLIAAIGFLVGAIGVGVVTLVRSSAYDRWANAEVAEEIPMGPTEDVVAAEQDIPRGSTLADIDAVLVAAEDDWAADLAEHTAWAERRLSSVAPVLPLQRRGGAS